MDVNKILKNNADYKMQDFTSRLVPNIKKESILGIKIPVLRNIAKDLINDKEIDLFLSNIPHKYLEENLLHVILLPKRYQDFSTLLKKIDEFLPYMDNWMVTDTLKSKLYNKYPDEGYKYVLKWLTSDRPYTIRYALVVLLNYYLKDNYKKEILEIVSKIDNDDYYVKMAISWFYSYALIYQYEDTINYFKENKLNKWIHNKSIQKAIESYQIDTNTKEYLRTLKIK